MAARRLQIAEGEGASPSALAERHRAFALEQESTAGVHRASSSQTRAQTRLDTEGPLEVRVRAQAREGLRVTGAPPARGGVRFQVAEEGAAPLGRETESRKVEGPLGGSGAVERSCRWMEADGLAFHLPPAPIHGPFERGAAAFRLPEMVRDISHREGRF